MVIGKCIRIVRGQILVEGTGIMDCVTVVLQITNPLRDQTS